DHIEYWRQFWEPVILTVWDAKSNITYWESIQKYLEELDESKSERKNVRVAIPTKNILDTDGVIHIARYTKSRYIENQQALEGAETLKELLKNVLEAEIAYVPKHGILLIVHAGYLYPIFFGSNNPLVNIAKQLS